MVDNMVTHYRMLFGKVTVLLFCLSVGGCGPATEQLSKEPQLLLSEQGLGRQIGDLAEVFASRPILVGGYGIVAGLAGNGSAQCPPLVRSSLKQYILQQLPKGHTLDVDGFISSNDTAVVRILGVIAPAASKDDRFDLRIEALAGTGTSSLAGGRLYTAKLIAMSRYANIARGTKELAVANGPVFIDRIDANKIDLRSGYVLGGGKVLDDYKITLSLRKPDYRMANAIRNRLDHRFGESVIGDVLPSTISLNVPVEYKQRKEQFIAVVKAMYLEQTPELTGRRIDNFVRKLTASKDKNDSEAGLEAIGKQSLGKLLILLKSANEKVRLRSARCALRLGSDEGLEVLQRIAFDRKSPRRIAAIEAIGTAARRNDAIGMLSRLL